MVNVVFTASLIFKADNTHICLLTWNINWRIEGSFSLGKDHTSKNIKSYFNNPTSSYHGNDFNPANQHR